MYTFNILLKYRYMLLTLQHEISLILAGWHSTTEPNNTRSIILSPTALLLLNCLLTYLIQRHLQKAIMCMSNI